MIFIYTSVIKINILIKRFRCVLLCEKINFFIYKRVIDFYNINALLTYNNTL